MSTRVIIRVDASIRIGGGHVIRCLGIAEALRRRGCEVRFLSQALPGNLNAAVFSRGFPVMALPPMSEAIQREWSVPHAESLGVDWSDDVEHTISCLTQMHNRPDWLIVDHYALDHRWETRIRPWVTRIMVIDDLANRSHDCDVLVDQVCVGSPLRYQGLVPVTCRQMIGADFILLRPEFGLVRSRPGFGLDWSLDASVHLFFGSSDGAGHALRFTRLLLSNFPNLKLKLAAANTSVFGEALEALSAESSGRLQVDFGVDDMASHMAECSVAIGTPGMSTWERACMGLPTLYLTNANSQTGILRKLKDLGFCEWLGEAEQISDDLFVDGVRIFLKDESGLERMRAAGLRTVDGNGLWRVIDAICDEGVDDE